MIFIISKNWRFACNSTLFRIWLCFFPCLFFQGTCNNRLPAFTGAKHLEPNGSSHPGARGAGSGISAARPGTGGWASQTTPPPPARSAGSQLMHHSHVTCSSGAMWLGQQPGTQLLNTDTAKARLGTASARKWDQEKSFILPLPFPTFSWTQGRTTHCTSEGEFWATMWGRIWYL